MGDGPRMTMTRAFSPGMATSLPTTTPNTVTVERDIGELRFVVTTPDGHKQTIDVNYGGSFGPMVDELLAIVEYRIREHQSGPEASLKFDLALASLRGARVAMSLGTDLEQSVTEQVEEAHAELLAEQAARDSEQDPAPDEVC